MTPFTNCTVQVLLAAVALLMPPAAFAQTAGQSPPPPAAPAAAPDTPEERSPGLPPHVKWTFNFDAGWGTFGFANSYYNNPKGAEQENLSDQWFEGFVKPSLSGSYKLGSSSELYGKVSVVGERTYGSAPGSTDRMCRRSARRMPPSGGDPGSRSGRVRTSST